MREQLRKDESGMALLTVLLVTMLASALMAGMFAAVVADQRSQGFDRDQSQAYAAAHAGLEKLTTQLAQLFITDFSPSATQITDASTTPPSVYGFNFVSPGGGAGYAVTFNADPCGTCPNAGNPMPSASNDITTGPFAGFKGLITPYTLTVTARSAGGGSEVRLRREVQTVAVPVFQFGVFGERSLSFHAGPNFDFGGRVHTNEHLFLAQGNGATLTFRDKMTTVGEVVRSQLENGNAITASGHTGTVVVPTVIGSTYRNLAATEGSVTDGPTSAGVLGWKNLSEAIYNTNIRNTLTGAKRLDLPLVSQGAVPIDLVRRPALNSNEDTANEPVFGQRYFAMASLRILLSDRAADLTGLPTITGGGPIELVGDWNAAPPGGVAAGRPLARAIGANAAAVSVSGVASTYAAPYHQIRVTAVPSTMLLPVNMTANVANVSCQGKTLSTFIKCTVSAAIPAGTVITGALPSGVVASTTVTAAVAASVGANDRTITVTANGTLGFAHEFAWINDRTNNRPSPMSCEGYDSSLAPQQLTNCRILGVTNAQTTNGRAIATHSLSAAGTSQIGGFIKIESQTAPGVWADVTAEILSLGFSAPNQEGTICADPTPNAVLRFQRLRDNGGFGIACPYAGSIDYRNYWPNVIYDAREGAYRDLATTGLMNMGGVINYVTIDVGNLKRWFAGTIGATGNASWNNNGYIVYFSDRRGNHDDGAVGQPETGEFGHEDSVNSPNADPTSSAPNAALDGGEDRNENTTLETYGGAPSALALYGATAPFAAGSTPLTQIASHPQARVNRQVFFRRALKITNGCIGEAAAVGGCTAANGVNNLPDSGLTITTENAVYVQGNYNATSNNVQAEPNRPSAIIADAINILSNNWLDIRSLNTPNDMAVRDATDTGYRFAMVGGKSIPFQRPGWAGAGDWGTDGGVHNFMRMLEDWGGRTTSYRGAMVSLYTARQFIGTYKANSNTYSPGTRAFAFDSDFLQPTLLPPGTPMFRDVNTLRFRQILRPNQ